MPHTLTLTAPATIQAAKSADKLPTFSILGYTGNVMRLAGWRHPVILDLEGGKVDRQDIPALMHHSDSQIVGHATDVAIDASGVHIEGVVSGTGAAAAEVVGNSKNGFGWQASVGADPGKVEHLHAGKTLNVNGRSVTGPMHVVRSWAVSEISFVPRGADSATSAAIAAKEHAMGSEHIEDLDPDTIERDRLRGIRAAFESNWDRLQQQGVGIEAMYDRAIGEGWTVPRAELEVERASRPKPQQFHGGNGDGATLMATNQSDVLQCAILQTASMPNLEKHFDEKTMQAAHTAFRGRLGIQQLMEICAAANGYLVSPGSRIGTGNLGEMMRYAEVPSRIQATGFSTNSLTGILGATGNKAAAMGYAESDQTWRQVAKILNVKDFKTVTTYRLLDDLEYEEIGPDGELKHGTMSEESYDRRAKTYGKMFALTRTDIINDDLDMLESIRTRLGLAAGVKISDVAWAAFMNNAAFFTAGHANYDEDTDTALGTDGAALQLAETLFGKLKSSDGKYIGGDASVLVVPPELGVKARMLYGSTNAGVVIDDNTIATAFRGLYRPVVQPRLSDTAFTGYSATAWYLLRNPAVAAVVALSFLNGRQTPIVEQAEVDFSQLGIQMRGYHDFGADQTNEYLAGVQMAGVNV